MTSVVDKVAVVGLGYVGLPLAVAFAKHLSTIGFDIDGKRIEELRAGQDRNGDVEPDLLRAPGLEFTSDPVALKGIDFLIVSVPTPVDEAANPDLSYLTSATRLVGSAIGATAHRRRPIISFESTVYPGCTEEVCVPLLEEASGLKQGIGFAVAYSPERINPGDREHTLDRIIKIVAAQDSETLDVAAEVYGLVAKAGVYRAPDIATAEAAKVIENIQRDHNIALMNELSMLFHTLGLNTREVLKAAGTKWNFLPFEPGLVGGHCIPVDPYYLAYKAGVSGYHTEAILVGRRVNDQMGRYVANEVIALIGRTGRPAAGARALVLGATFKENVSDVRNSRVVDLVGTLRDAGVLVDVYDPVAPPGSLSGDGIETDTDPFVSDADTTYNALIIAVPHDAFRERPFSDYRRLLPGKGLGVIADLKGLFSGEAANDPDVIYWTL
jgi:UDP-N-acetyl-D-galactosamine dehydrogenase